MKAPARRLLLIQQCQHQFNVQLPLAIRTLPTRLETPLQALLTAPNLRCQHVQYRASSLYPAVSAPVQQIHALDRGPGHDVDAKVVQWQPPVAKLDERTEFINSLRLLLLEDSPQAAHIWGHLKYSRWLQDLDVSKDIDGQEKELLLEALQVVIRQTCNPKQAVTMEGASIRSIIKLYTDLRLLGHADWANMLSSFSTDLYTTATGFEHNGFADQAVFCYAMNRSIAEVLVLWEQFFHYYQLQPSGADFTGRMWTIVRSRSAYHGSPHASNDFIERLLSFAPGWPQGFIIFADRQIMCSVWMTLAAILKIRESGSRLCTMFSQMSEPQVPDADADAEWSAEVLQSMSRAELSLLYIISRAAKNATVNPTVIRFGMSQMAMSADRANDLVDGLRKFLAKADEALTAQDQYHDRVIDGSFHETLSESVQGPKSILTLWKSIATLEQANLALATCQKLASRFGTAELVHTSARMISLKYWELGAKSQALGCWKSMPDLHMPMPFWVKALKYCHNKGDVTQFEEVWSSFRSVDVFIPLELWKLRLNFLGKKGMLTNLVDAFNTMYRLSRGITSPGSSGTRCQSILQLDTDVFNHTIDVLLQNKSDRIANDLYELLQNHPHLEPNVDTCKLFFYSTLDPFDVKSANLWLRRMQIADFPVRDEEISSYVLARLTTGPESAMWADAGEIFTCFGTAFHYRYDIEGFDFSGRRHEDSLYPQLTGQSTNMYLRSAQIASTMTPAQFKHSLLQTYNAIRTRVVNRAVPERRTRLLFILWDFVNDLLGPFVDAECSRADPELGSWRERIREDFSEWVECLSRRDQLLLLSGDIFQEPHLSEYRNFKFVSAGFAAHYLAGYLSMLGFDDYETELRRLSWQGFDRFDQQSLIDIGILSPTSRSRITWEIQQMAMEARYYSSQILHKQERTRKEACANLRSRQELDISKPTTISRSQK